MLIKAKKTIKLTLCTMMLMVTSELNDSDYCFFIFINIFFESSCYLFSEIFEDYYYQKWPSRYSETSKVANNQGRHALFNTSNNLNRKNKVGSWNKIFKKKL